MINRPSRRIRIEDVIHRSSPEQLLLSAIVQPASARPIIDRELDRRAQGDLPEGIRNQLWMGGMNRAAFPAP